MVFLHQLIAAELGMSKKVSFAEIGKLYMKVFTKMLLQFLTGLTPTELKKILNATLQSASNVLTSYYNAFYAAILAISVVYLYNNYIKK